MRAAQNIIIVCVLLGTAGCANVNVGGGERPIHIVMDINLKIDRDLDQFFSFEQNPAGFATEPATAPAPTSATLPTTNALNG